MNKSLEKINIENFNTALDLSSKDYTYEELISMIICDEVITKQIAILNLSEIKTKEDAKLLASMLTGQDGKIREVTAFKLNEIALNPKFMPLFIQDAIFNKFLNGFMDINGNICRMVVNLIQIDEFKKYLAIHLPEVLDTLIADIKTQDLTSRQYILSKKSFQLYWNLEALSHITEYIDYDKIIPIVEYTSSFPDYTIREKAAKVLSQYNSQNARELRNKLLADENYYVKRCACSSVE